MKEDIQHEAPAPKVLTPEEIEKLKKKELVKEKQKDEKEIVEK